MTKDNIGILKTDCVIKNCLFVIEGKSLGEVVLNFAKHYREVHS